MNRNRSEPKRYEPVMEGELKCRVCKETQPYDQFYVNRVRNTGRESICKNCSVVKNKTHRESGYVQPRKADPAQSERSMKRRVRMKYQLTTELPRGWRTSLLAFYENCCLQCGSTDRLEVDHVIPLSKGGTHSLDNFQILCKKHNLSKHNKYADYRNGKVFTLDTQKPASLLN